MPLTRRCGGGKEVLVSTTEVWPVSRINFIVRNPVYKGLHVFKARGGPIEREVPSLVSPELWQAANDQLKRNKSLPLRNGTRKNLLRGLIRCADCGYRYTGSPSYPCLTTGSCDGSLCSRSRSGKTSWRNCSSGNLVVSQPPRVPIPGRRVLAGK